MNNSEDTNSNEPAEQVNQGYSAAGEVGSIKSRRSFTQNVWRGLKTAPPTALFGLTVISIYAIFAIFAPLLAPYGEAEIFDLSYAPWSDEFMFGTDQLGRDVLSRLIYGARNTVGIAFVTTIFAFTIGGGLGNNASQFGSTVGGGRDNTASGTEADETRNSEHYDIRRFVVQLTWDYSAAALNHTSAPRVPNNH